MRHQTRFFALITSALLLLSAAACGQKDGVAEQAFTTAGGVGGALPEGATVNEEGDILDASGNVIGNVEEGLFSDTGTGSSFATGGSTTGSTTSGTGSTTGGSGSTGGSSTGGSGSTGGTEPSSGGSAIGVTDKEIKIGLHAPLTGAAPVPSDSVQQGKDLYTNWLKAQGKDLNGRQVVTVLKNDNYNPSQAVAVCKEMVEKDKVFFLFGTAGTDQIQACARYSASVGVPYISAGVTEIGLTGLPGYFAITMTYPDQGPMLADFMVSRLGASGEKNGMLRFETPNFQDAHDAFLEGMDQAGADVVYDRAVSKNAGTSEAQTAVQEMQTAGIENVYILTSPVWFLQLLKAANAQAYRPQWVGVGITMTFDTVANVACPDGNSLNGAKFFAPFPAWSESDKFDPDFRKASNAHSTKGNGDDFMFLSWGISKVLDQLLRLPGRELTRERFVYFTERARNIKTGVLPPVSFSADDHYGSSQVHINEANCSDRRWHNIASFVSGF